MVNARRARLLLEAGRGGEQVWTGAGVWAFGAEHRVVPRAVGVPVLVLDLGAGRRRDRDDEAHRRHRKRTVPLFQDEACRLSFASRQCDPVGIHRTCAARFPERGVPRLSCTSHFRLLRSSRIDRPDYPSANWDAGEQSETHADVRQEPPVKCLHGIKNQEVDMRGTRKMILGISRGDRRCGCVLGPGSGQPQRRGCPGVVRRSRISRSKTGQVWMPETVGQDGRPLAGPQDKAFDPNAQDGPAMIGEQRVRGRPVGTVPVTAGPTTPILAMDGATLLRAGKRWQVVMYLDNNSANPVDPVIECRFLNGAATVMTTREPRLPGRRRACGKASSFTARAPTLSSIARPATSCRHETALDGHDRKSLEDPMMIAAALAVAAAGRPAPRIPRSSFASSRPIGTRLHAGDGMPNCRASTPSPATATRQPLRNGRWHHARHDAGPPNVFTTMASPALTSTSPPTCRRRPALDVSEPRIGCRWSAIAR